MEQKVSNIVQKIGRNAKNSLELLRKTSLEQKNDALNFSAELVQNNYENILEANEKDITFAKEKGIKKSLLQRLELDEKKIKYISQSLINVAKLPNPLGKVLDHKQRPNGLTVKKITVLQLILQWLHARTCSLLNFPLNSHLFF